MKFECLCYHGPNALLMRLVQAKENSQGELADVVHLVIAQISCVVLLADVLYQLFQTSLFACKKVPHEERIARVYTVVVDDQIVHQNEDASVESNRF